MREFGMLNYTIGYDLENVLRCSVDSYKYLHILNILTSTAVQNDVFSYI